MWQTRPCRMAMKLGLSYAAENRDGVLVDLFSTLLPTSHKSLLEAEVLVT